MLLILVIAGLVPAIHIFLDDTSQDMDARHVACIFLQEWSATGQTLSKISA